MAAGRIIEMEVRKAAALKTERHWLSQRKKTRFKNTVDKEYSSNVGAVTINSDNSFCLL